MKNQYVGDIGDYGKYSLLRAFANAGVKVGVNWYLTADDGSNDGKFTGYLQSDKMRRYSPEVFDALGGIADKPDKTVIDIEESGIIPGAIFYTELLRTKGGPADREMERRLWFEESVSELSGAELIFMDPDNGLLESGDATRRGAERYVLPEEVERYFIAGHNVVYYCHKGRRSYDQWRAYKDSMFERIKAAKPVILTYHKGSQRSYIFLIHEKNFVGYRKVIDSLLFGWHRIFSEEFTSMGDLAAKSVGDAFVLEKSDGTVVTIEKRMDGRIQMWSSRKPGERRVMKMDYFCQYIGF